MSARVVPPLHIRPAEIDTKSGAHEPVKPSANYQHGECRVTSTFQSRVPVLSIPQLRNLAIPIHADVLCAWKKSRSTTVRGGASCAASNVVHKRDYETREGSDGEISNTRGTTRWDQSYQVNPAIRLAGRFRDGAQSEPLRTRANPAGERTLDWLCCK